MDRADFIITVYCLVCDQYQMIQSQHQIRRGGFAPTLTDEEVITIELCGEFVFVQSLSAQLEVNGWLIARGLASSMTGSYS